MFLVLALATAVNLHSSQPGTQEATAASPETTTANALFLPVIYDRYCPSPVVDNFTDPNSGWPIVDTGSIIYRYLHGEYNMYHRDANMWGAATRGDVWNQSKRLEVRGRIVQNQGVWGLLFALNDDWTDFYTFEISPNDQRWFVFHYTSSGGWQLISQGTSSAIQPGTAYNTIPSYSRIFLVKSH
jgi:hypothetical protein